MEYALELNKDVNTQKEALNWLGRAKKYSGKTSFSELVDLSQFFKEWKWIEGHPLFFKRNRELAEAVAPFVRYLSLPIGALGYSSDVYEEITSCFEAFLRKAISLEITFDGKSDNIHLYLQVLIRALATTSAIKRLVLSDTKIGDDIAIKILEAIENNPRSPLEYINFANCNLSDNSALKVSKLLKKNQALKEVNLAQNFQITCN